MTTTVALFLVLCLLAVQANPSGEGGTGAGAGTGADSGNDGGTGAGAGTGADSGNDGGTGAGAGSGSDRGSGAGAVSGSDGGPGTGADSGSDDGAGAEAGSGSDGGSSDGYFKRPANILNRIDLDQILSGAGRRLVIIYFMATWCNSCQIIEPQLYKLASEYPTSIIVPKVDKNKARDVAMDYEIDVVPTFVFVKNYTRLDVLYGAHYEKLRSIVLRLK